MADSPLEQVKQCKPLVAECLHEIYWGYQNKTTKALIKEVHKERDNPKAILDPARTIYLLIERNKYENKKQRA